MADYACFEIDATLIALLSRPNSNFITATSSKRRRYKFVYLVCAASSDMEVISVYLNFYFNPVS